MPEQQVVCALVYHDKRLVVKSSWSSQPTTEMGAKLFLKKERQLGRCLQITLLCAGKVKENMATNTISSICLQGILYIDLLYHTKKADDQIMSVTQFTTFCS